MEGLLLQLLDDRNDDSKNWFWPCFAPLRAEFDNHYWVISGELSMVRVPGFYDEHGNSETIVDDPRLNEVQVQLWRPGTISRWAEYFCGEFISLLAIDGPEPIETAIAYGQSKYDDDFREKHVAIWLSYTDSTCWEIFTRESTLLERVKKNASKNPAIRAYKAWSQNRQFGTSQMNFDDAREPKM